MAAPCCFFGFTENCKNISVFRVLLQIRANVVPPLGGGGVPPPVRQRLHAARRLRRVRQVRRRCRFLQPPEPGHPEQHSEEGGRSEAAAAASAQRRGVRSHVSAASPSVSTQTATRIIAAPFAAAPPHGDDQQRGPPSGLDKHFVLH